MTDRQMVLKQAKKLNRYHSCNFLIFFDFHLHVLVILYIYLLSTTLENN